MYVVDRQGTHRDDCIFSTDLSLSPKRIVSLFTRRGSTEVTLEEVRAHLGFETTRQHVARSVLRMAPCLLGLFTVITLAFASHQRRHRVRPARTPWYDKHDLTFSDAIVTVRQQLWSETVFGISTPDSLVPKLPRSFRTRLLDALSQAA